MASKRPPSVAMPRSAEIDAYVAALTEPARARFATLRDLIRALAPAATERMAYGLPTWHQGENLIHLGAFAHHLGIYPGPAAIVEFASALTGFKTSKGAIQVAHDARLPVVLVRQLVRWRLAQVAAKAAAPSPATSTRRKLATSATKPGTGATRAKPSIRAKADAAPPRRAAAAASTDWRVNTLERMRALVLAADPAIVEERKWRKPSNGMVGVPVWSAAGIVCTGETYAKAVKLTFAHGAAVPDPARLFNASLDGGTRRAIDLREGETIDAAAFTALVRAAVARNRAVTEGKPAVRKPAAR